VVVGWHSVIEGGRRLVESGALIPLDQSKNSNKNGGLALYHLKLSIKGYIIKQKVFRE